MAETNSRNGIHGWIAPAAIALAFGAAAIAGVTWGLPNRTIDRYLFGEDEPWSGEKIHRLAGAGERFSPLRGADVDADPLDRSSDAPVHLTATDEDVARIYLRYRLYTYQPDEMITMMALAGMRPGQFDFDPRLYQYGGLFIYPVGALIKACDLVGLIDVRSDVTYYLDNPAEFGKFYIVARLYAGAWGLVGVFVVFAIARRLGGSRAGWLAALLYTLAPVVVCMAHEGKPHLPGAVLMLLAVLLAMRHLDSTGRPAWNDTPEPRALARAMPRAPRARRNWWLMCICCGASLGMVLSSLPIFVLIALVGYIEWRRHVGEGSERAHGHGFGRIVGGLGVASLTYLMTNPYIVINALGNRDVLRSNFGNSLAMYRIDRILEGFLRVIELTVEGTTLPILLLGVAALIFAWRSRNGAILPLVVPAVVFFVQFVLMGAGKPAEYGRFGIFVDTALIIGTACLLGKLSTTPRVRIAWGAVALVVIWTGLCGGAYLRNFQVDTTQAASRIALAQNIRLLKASPSRDAGPTVALLAEPAPYGCPPLNFAKVGVILLSRREQFGDYAGHGCRLITPVDRPSMHEGVPQAEGSRWWCPRTTPISWANKPFELSEIAD